MSGAALSESRMHWMIEQIQDKVRIYGRQTKDADVTQGTFPPSPGEVLREIREFIDSELARPHLILWRMMALYPEKEYKVTSVHSVFDISAKADSPAWESVRRQLQFHFPAEKYMLTGLEFSSKSNEEIITLTVKEDPRS